jgi:hypothetical protein
LITNFWHGFNKDISHIDAVYERVHDDTIVFFVGANYYEFTANVAKPGYPRWAPACGIGVYECRPLTDFLLKENDRIDAAMIWEYNGVTYFFGQGKYWRFDEVIVHASTHTDTVNRWIKWSRWQRIRVT